MFFLYNGKYKNEIRTAISISNTIHKTKQKSSPLIGTKSKSKNNNFNSYRHLRLGGSPELSVISI